MLCVRASAAAAVQYDNEYNGCSNKTRSTAAAYDGADVSKIIRNDVLGFVCNSIMWYIAADRLSWCEICVLKKMSWGEMWIKGLMLVNFTKSSSVGQ